MPSVGYTRNIVNKRYYIVPIVIYFITLIYL